MARLTDEELTLEITVHYRNQYRPDRWFVLYEVGFIWDYAPVVNDSIISGYSYGCKRSPGKFMIGDHDGPYLIDTIRKTLATDAPDYWEPIEPDAIIAFYPGMHFPFLPSHMQMLWESSELQQSQEKKQQDREAAGGVLPSDVITVIAFINSGYLSNNSGYAGSGLAVVLSPSHLELERFCEQLAIEYESAPVKTQ